MRHKFAPHHNQHLAYKTKDIDIRLRPFISSQTPISSLHVSLLFLGYLFRKWAKPLQLLPENRKWRRIERGNTTMNRVPHCRARPTMWRKHSPALQFVNTRQSGTEKWKSPETVLLLPRFLMLLLLLLFRLILPRLLLQWQLALLRLQQRSVQCSAVAELDSSLASQVPAPLNFAERSLKTSFY